MPQILKPSDFAARLKGGEDGKAILYDASGARQAKLIGLKADVAAGAEDRSVDFVISTGAVDRYNSTIAVAGWQTDNFNSNPVILWAHDDSIPAIGRASKTRVDGGKLKSSAIFAERDVHPLADTVYRLIKAKFLGAASVGWIPLKWQFVEDKDRGFGIDYLEQELLEWSVVNIPANPDCLVGARAVGIDTRPLLLWAERTLDLGGFTAVPRDELEALWRAAGAPSQFRGRLLFRSDSADWKCGASRDFALEDDDGWDGAAAEKAIFAAYGFDGDKPDAGATAKCFLAHDASTADKKGSYKLPFVKMVDGKPKASASGLKACAQRLSATDIPSDVKDSAQGVIDHYKSKMGDDDKSAAALRRGVRAAIALVAEAGPEAAVAAVMALVTKYVRAGKVVSKKNEEKLRKACDHMDSARQHCMDILNENDGLDPGQDPEHPEDPDDDGDEERQAQRVRDLRAKAKAA